MRRHLPTRIELAVLVFCQMLPATMLTPAIRPLLAAQHGNREAAMHAFFAAPMLGATLLSPLLSRWAASSVAARAAKLSVLDAVFVLFAIAPLPTSAVLAFRVGEGATHVAVASVLFGLAARRREHGDELAVPVAGSALMAAIATGSALGGGLLGLGGLHAPFVTAFAIALLVGLRLLLRNAGQVPAPAAIAPGPRPSLSSLLRAAWVPASTAFAARFSIGCLVVTFSLFAHRVHGLSDLTIGLLFSSMTVPFALAMYPAGRVVGRSSPRRALVLGSAGYAACLVSLGWVPTPALGPTLALAGVSCAFLFAAALSLATVIGAATEREVTVGLVNAAGCAGMLLGPAVAGVTSAITRSLHGPAFAARLVFALAATAVAGVALIVLAADRLTRSEEALGPPAARHPVS